MKISIPHYTILISIVILIIFEIDMLIGLNVPIKDSALTQNMNYSALYYLKYTSTYLLYLLFGIIGFLLLTVKNKLGLFFSTLFVIYLLISSVFVVKSNWIYFTKWGVFLLFFLINFYFKSYKEYGLKKAELINYIYILTLICLIEFVPLFFSSL